MTIVLTDKWDGCWFKEYGQANRETDCSSHSSCGEVVRGAWDRWVGTEATCRCCQQAGESAERKNPRWVCQRKWLTFNQFVCTESWEGGGMKSLWMIMSWISNVLQLFLMMGWCTFQAKKKSVFLSYHGVRSMWYRYLILVASLTMIVIMHWQLVSFVFMLCCVTPTQTHGSIPVWWWAELSLHHSSFTLHLVCLTKTPASFAGLVETSHFVTLPGVIVHVHTGTLHAVSVNRWLWVKG